MATQLIGHVFSLLLLNRILLECRAVGRLRGKQYCEVFRLVCSRGRCREEQEKLPVTLTPSARNYT